jgi:Skp family chaperone for outer membrane proteins
MNLRSRFLIVTVAVLLATAGSLIAAEKPSGMKIGFVNLKKVFTDFLRSKTMEKEIENFQNEEEKKLEKMKKDINDLEKELDLVRRSSKEWFNIRKDIVRKRKALETDEKLAKIEIQRRLLKATEEIYEDILAQISDYSKKNGFAMVLKIETGRIDSESSVELSMKVNSRGVLFFRKDLEITDAIIHGLNASYSGPGEKKDDEKKDDGKKDDDKKDDGKKDDDKKDDDKKDDDKKGDDKKGDDKKDDKKDDK